jgi:hypothetical protein
MKKLIYISLTIFIIVFLIVAYKDYQRRMFIHNANYQCIYGDDRYCNLLIEMEMRGEIK